MPNPITYTLLKLILPAGCLVLTACATSPGTGIPLITSTSPLSNSTPVGVPTPSSLPTIPALAIPSQDIASSQSEQASSPAVNFRYQSPPGYEKVEKPGQVSLYSPDKGVFIFFIVMVDDHQTFSSLEEHLQSFMDNPSSDYNVFKPGKCYPYQVSGVEGYACEFSGERKTIPMTGRMILAYPSQNTYLFALTFAFDGQDSTGWPVNGLPDSDRLLSSLKIWEESSQ